MSILHNYQLNHNKTSGPEDCEYIMIGLNDT